MLDTLGQQSNHLTCTIDSGATIDGLEKVPAWTDVSSFALYPTGPLSMTHAPLIYTAEDAGLILQHGVEVATPFLEHDRSFSLSQGSDMFDGALVNGTFSGTSPCTTCGHSPASLVQGTQTEDGPPGQVELGSCCTPPSLWETCHATDAAIFGEASQDQWQKDLGLSTMFSSWFDNLVHQGEGQPDQLQCVVSPALREKNGTSRSPDLTERVDSVSNLNDLEWAEPRLLPRDHSITSDGWSPLEEWRQSQDISTVLEEQQTIHKSLADNLPEILQFQNGPIPSPKKSYLQTDHSLKSSLQWNDHHRRIIVPPAWPSRPKVQRLRMQPQPRLAQRQDARDLFLVQSKLAGMSYREIRDRGNFTEAESTLRGRFRTLTKEKENRVRKPEWKERDVGIILWRVRHVDRF